MSVFIRIFLRYIAGALIAKGLIDNQTGQIIATDPELVNVLMIAVGSVIGAASEAWYWLARKAGWRT